jgi:uncharacterized protein
MLFARRQSETLLIRTRVALWPRRSWKRSTGYVMGRLARLKATPEHVACGFAAGVFAATTPLLGLQIVLALALAFVLRVHATAAVFGTFAANPLTMPFLYGGSFQLGCLMLGTDPAMQAAMNREAGLAADGLIGPVLLPMLLGSIPLGLFLAALSFEIVRNAMVKLRARRGSPLPAARTGRIMPA